MPEPTGTNATQEKKTGMRAALAKIEEGLKDLSSLEVQTYVGAIDVAIDDDRHGLKDISALLSSAKAKDSGLKLCAVTKMMCDGDAINLVPEEAFPEHIQKVHEAAVRAGIATREGLLALFGGMVGLTPTK